MKFRIMAILSLCVSYPSLAQTFTLEQIMADEDWMGNSPESAYWADDSDSMFYSQKKAGSKERDLREINLDGKILRTVADKDLGTVCVAGGDYDSKRAQKVYARNGDLFVKQLPNGKIRQLTQTREAESDPQFMADNERVWFLRGDVVFVRNLETGLEYQVADVRAEKDPDAEDEKFDFLKDQQQRLFDVLKTKEKDEDDRKAREKAQREADPTHLDPPWYLNEDVEIGEMVLAPRGDYLVVRYTSKKEKKEGKKESMPNYVTETGYTETKDVRARVGTDTAPSDQLMVLDLTSRRTHKLDLSALAGIFDDPLKDLRQAAEEKRKAAAKTEVKSISMDTDEAEETEDEKKDEKPKARPVFARGIVWNEAGTELVIQARSQDNKDRWIARIDLKEWKVVPLYRETDPAWVMNRLIAWLGDDRSIYFLSEETGYSHLYAMNVHDGVKRALTSGDYEVSGVTFSGDKRHLYYRANVKHPGIYEVYRVSTGGGRSEQLSNLGGNNSFVLSPNDDRLLIMHSTTTQPPEIYYQRASDRASARRLTHTISEAFDAIEWVEPQIVEVPSTHGAGKPIYSRLYLPKTPSSTPRPAVVFIHGAGYLQNAHAGWSSYSHEFMFHSLLVQEGYVVLDMDYRASAGYGRDWRTAIYRQMGTPEVQDLADGVAWLAREHNVDPKRVGCYGGSYGGFLTLMALFREPDLFACGAALRPVTDWAHYNHGYTSNILNVPLTDPEAYTASSPIEFAAGLQKPLLICHGMQDDNVFFQDSVRLAQRLIELKKENWEFAVYPVEAHGFDEATSWLDEYRRIFKLFEENLTR